MTNVLSRSSGVLPKASAEIHAGTTGYSLWTAGGELSIGRHIYPNVLQMGRLAPAISG
ncbi:hypothetical protein [Fodinicola feengrottensis]|uniref:hypothetical protein n=1 Tax=Fodinicola feengrottensis TaxID=435914 RepID=UPI0031D9C879